MGFLIGIVDALALAFMNTNLRRLAQVPTRLVNWVRFAVGSSVLAILVSFFSQWVVPPIGFWFILVGALLPLELLGTFLYTRALQRSPQSLVGPLYSLSLIFLIPVSYIALHEMPTPLGVAGVVTTLIGALTLGWDFKNPGMRPAIISLLREPGSLYMLGAAVLGASVIVSAKASFHYASPLLSAFYDLAGLLIVNTAFIRPNLFRKLDGQWRYAIGAAIAEGISVTATFIGISMLISAYYVAVKQLNIVFNVLLGRFIGKEKHADERLIGALLMTIGIALIILAT